MHVCMYCTILYLLKLENVQKSLEVHTYEVGNKKVYLFYISPNSASYYISICMLLNVFYVCKLRDSYVYKVSRRIEIVF